MTEIQMTDIHMHILPGVDDGAMDMYDTLDMASMAADSRVTTILATPHCNIPGMFANYYGEEYREIFRRAEEAIEREGIPVRLCPGMEAFGTYDLPRLIEDGKVITLNQSRYLLIEFAFDENPDYADHVLDKVDEMGLVPVIAHAERYEFVQDDLQLAYRWRKKGYLIQMNKGSIVGRFGRDAWKAASQLMDHNLISVIASDAHGPVRRTPYMLDVYRELKKEYPERYLKILFEENPKRICENQWAFPYPIKSFEGREK